MKKLFVFMMAALMLMPAAVSACEGGAILPDVDAGTGTVSGEAWVALSSETNMLYGKLYPEEKLRTYAAQTVRGTFVRGIQEDSVIRQKGEMRYTEINGAVCGLTGVQVRVEIREAYKAAASAVIERRMGGCTEITASNVIACTLGRTERTVYHYIFRKNADKVEIGTVTFNENSVTGLYLGDWNGDGLMEFGFMAGVGTCKQTTPEPEPAATPQPAKKQPTVSPAKKNCAQNTCTGVTNSGIIQIQINNQVNFGGTFNNTQTVNIGNGGGCRRNECTER